MNIQDLTELTLPKNKWEFVVSSADKGELSADFINLVNTAYTGTIYGSFVNSLKDVLASDWQVYTYDDEAKPNCVIFYRNSRPDEAWTGFKVQGVGHDGLKPSRIKVMARLTEILKRPGWFIECNQGVKKSLLKSGAPIVTSEEYLRKIYPNSFLTMIDKVTYNRTLPTGRKLTESTFGNPRLK